MMIIPIGNDHAALELKNFLISKLSGEDLQFEDCGTMTCESCDYPVFARKVCEKVLGGAPWGILLCGSGIGMSMVANRFAGIRAALCGTELQASLARRHNNANILCMGARITGQELALAITRAFMEAAFEGGRHQRRINLFDSMGKA